MTMGMKILNNVEMRVVQTFEQEEVKVGYILNDFNVVMRILKKVIESMEILKEV